MCLHNCQREHTGLKEKNYNLMPLSQAVKKIKADHADERVEISFIIDLCLLLMLLLLWHVKKSFSMSHCAIL